MSDADVIIVALPTPIDDEKNPDLFILKKASETIGANLKMGSVVVYESTVYPGVTEDICGPILEGHSGMVSGKDFFLGYSPERINPGDKVHTVTQIIKIVAGQNQEVTNQLCELYGSIVEAGIHRAPNIKTAEMGKAIENAQRDLNIAYVNEIAVLCHAIGINSHEVLEAAGTKWNFLPFKPGLVGGHCIGVDPYYLVELANQLGVKTHVVSAGRDVNESMPDVVAHQVFSKLHVPTNESSVLVMGLTFKENVPDQRNSKSIDVVEALASAGCSVAVHDPHVNDATIASLNLTKGELGDKKYDAILLLVSHDEYVNISTDDFKNSLTQKGIFYDLKATFKNEDWTGVTYLSL
jgi:UDP-N-acetyl-D-galactosamine dehydrogenase